MRRRSTVALIGLLACLLASSTAVLAQNATPATAAPPSAKSIQTYNKEIFVGLKAVVLRAAEMMPEEAYAFKPVDSVRTYGQILGHIADSQYFFCSTALEQTNPSPKVEKTKTTKAELIAALRDAFAYTEKAFDGMTDQSAAQMVTLMGNAAPKLGVLTTNSLHTVEHYGNLVTYLRMKGLVPPTSDPAFMQAMRGK